MSDVSTNLVSEQVEGNQVVDKQSFHKKCKSHTSTCDELRDKSSLLVQSREIEATAKQLEELIVTTQPRRAELNQTPPQQEQQENQTHKQTKQDEHQERSISTTNNQLQCETDNVVALSNESHPYYRKENMQRNQKYLHTKPVWNKETIDKYLQQILQKYNLENASQLSNIQRFRVEPRRIADTLQGSIHYVMDVTTGRRLIMKRAKKDYVHKNIARCNIYVKENVVEEAKLMKRISRNDGTGDAGFCQFSGFWEDDQNYYLVMEYGGYSYFEFVRMGCDAIINGELTVEEWQDIIRFQFRQFACTLYYFHKIVEIAHLDLSLENCVVDTNGNLRIIDFGLAHDATNTTRKHSCDDNDDTDDKKKEEKEENMKKEDSVSYTRWKSCHYVGKKEYMAPEVRELRKYHSIKYGTKSVPSNERYDTRAADMWSAGLVLFRSCFWLSIPWKVEHGQIDPESAIVYDYVVNRSRLLEVVQQMGTNLAAQNSKNLDISNWKEMDLAVEVMQSLLKPVKHRATIDDIMKMKYISEAPLELSNELKQKLARIVHRTHVQQQFVQQQQAQEKVKVQSQAHAHAQAKAVKAMKAAQAQGRVQGKQIQQIGPVMSGHPQSSYHSKISKQNPVARAGSGVYSTGTPQRGVLQPLHHNIQQPNQSNQPNQPPVQIQTLNPQMAMYPHGYYQHQQTQHYAWLQQQQMYAQQMQQQMHQIQNMQHRHTHFPHGQYRQ